MGTLTADEMAKQMAELNAYYNKYGYTLVLIRTPRSSNYIRKYDPNRKIDRKTWFGATNVRERREQMRLSVYELAKEMDVDKNIVLRMENDEQRHAYCSMVRFANYFGCEIEDLLK